MAEAPAMPFWTDAYLADTGHLTTIEHGAYLLLLMAGWRAGGRLPNDDKKLSRIAHLTGGQWARIGPTIRAFFKIEGEWLVQPRQMDELEFVRQKSKTQSINARSKYRKDKGVNPAAAEPRDSGGSPPTPIEVPPTSPQISGEVQRAFDEFSAAYPKRGGNDPTEPARTRFADAVMAGADPQAIIAGARTYAAEQAKLGNTGTEFIRQRKAWLGDRAWQDYQPRPSATVTATIWVPQDSPEWKQRAAAYKARHGKDPPHTSGLGGSGWHFPAEAIPQHAA